MEGNSTLREIWHHSKLHKKDEKTPKSSDFSVFPSKKVVAGEGFEPTTSGLSLRAALRFPKNRSGFR